GRGDQSAVGACRAGQLLCHRLAGSLGSYPAIPGARASVVRVRLLAEAEAEAQEAAQWYDGRQAGLGDAFLSALSVGLEAIELHPTRCARVSNVLARREVRRFLLKRFPYKVIFE